MIVVGVTGFKQSGKSTIVSVLEKHGFTLYAFADALRVMAAAINPMISLSGGPEDVVQEFGPKGSQAARYNTILEVVGYERAKTIPDFRGFLQRLGTDGIRGTFGPNAWVDALARRIDAEAPARVAISDVRFGSEADFVHARGGVLWRVSRPGVGGDDPHPSEAEIPLLPADVEIANDTSLDALEHAVIDRLAVVVKSAVS